MKTISIWNPKGGQGKSLLALNLAACAVTSFDLQPIVVDQDPQGTCQECSSGRKLRFDVVSELTKGNTTNADLAIIDHQASDWELPDSKTLVMPVLPTRTQYKTFSRAYILAQKNNKNIVIVANNVDLNRKQESSAAKELRQNGAFVLQKGSPFGHAESHLSTIFDDSIPAIRNGYHVNQRRAEIEAILTAVLRET